MISRKTILQNIKDLQDKVNGFIPTQTYQNLNNMAAQEMIIDAQVGSSNVLNKTIYGNQGIIINQGADYFCNVFRYEAEDYAHTLFINRAVRYSFIYGYVGIGNNNGTPEIVSIFERDNEVYANIISEDNDERPQSKSFYEFNNENKKGFKVNRADLIKYKFTSLGFGAFIILEPVINGEQLVQKALYNETLMLPTRIIHDSENIESGIKATRQILDFNSPVMHKAKDGTDTFRPLTLSYATNELLSTIEYAKNYYYDILGRRANTDFKKTHSLNAEIEAGQDNFDILERDKYLHLKHFLRQYAKLFNQEIILENSAGDYQNVNDKDIMRPEVKEVQEGAQNEIERD